MKNTAYDLYSQGKYAKAEKAFRKNLALEPSDPDTIIMLGRCLFEQGKSDKAINCYQKAIGLCTDDDDRAYAHYFLGLAYGSLEEHIKAEAAFRESLGLNPSDSYIFFNLGISLANQGKYDEAIGYFERALELSTGDEERASAHAQLGFVSCDKDDWEYAIENYETAIQLSDKQKTAEIFFNLGVAYAKLEEYVKAETAFRESLTLNPSDTYTIRNLGVILLFQEKYDESIHYNKKAIELSTDEEERGCVYATLGETYQKKNEWECAIENYEAAICLSKEQKTAENFLNLAFAYEQLEDYAKAETTYRELLALEPSNPDANAKLAFCLERQKKV